MNFENCVCNKKHILVLNDIMHGQTNEECLSVRYPKLLTHSMEQSPS